MPTPPAKSSATLRSKPPELSKPKADLPEAMLPFSNAGLPEQVNGRLPLPCGLNSV